MTEATALNTQADRLAEAKRKQTERENGIRANAIKQGMEQERKAQQAERERIVSEYEGKLSGLIIGQADEISRHEMHAERLRRAHGWAMFFNGGLTFTAVAGAIVAIGLAWYTQAIMVPTFDAARESRVQDDVLRTLQDRPPTTNQPRSQSAP